MQKGLGLLLAAAAAYGYYRYSKMTPEQKNNLRQKGKDFLIRTLVAPVNCLEERIVRLLPAPIVSNLSGVLKGT